MYDPCGHIDRDVLEAQPRLVEAAALCPRHTEAEKCSSEEAASFRRSPRRQDRAAIQDASEAPALPRKQVGVGHSLHVPDE